MKPGIAAAEALEAKRTGWILLIDTVPIQAAASFDLIGSSKIAPKGVMAEKIWKPNLCRNGENKEQPADTTALHIATLCNEAGYPEKTKEVSQSGTR